MPYKDPESKKLYQRKYNKEYYKKNKDKAKVWALQYYIDNKDRINKHNIDARKARRSRSILGYLESKYSGISCIDCDTVYAFCVMDFDHRPEEIKSFGIATKNDLLATPERISQLEKEIDKCDLVCANCHRVRTHIERRGKEFKNAPTEEYEISSEDYYQERKEDQDPVGLRT